MLLIDQALKVVIDDVHHVSLEPVTHDEIANQLHQRLLRLLAIANDDLSSLPWGHDHAQASDDLGALADVSALVTFQIPRRLEPPLSLGRFLGPAGLLLITPLLVPDFLQALYFHINLLLD